MNDVPMSRIKVLVFASVGVFVDTIQAIIGMISMIPIVGWALGPVANLCVSMSALLLFSILLRGKDASTGTVAKRWTLKIMVVVFEFMPFLSVIPCWTAYAFFTALLLRKEQQKEYNQRMEEAVT